MNRLPYLIILSMLFMAVSTNEASGQVKAEINGLASGLLLDELSIDASYHPGVLELLELQGEVRLTRSSFCLSCHDGIFVKSGHVDTNVGNWEDDSQRSIFILDHPVSFEYSKDMQLTRDYLNDFDITPSGLGGTVADDLLVEGRIECVTCHNILFRDGEKEKYEILNKGNGGSALCLTCHKR